MERHGLAEDVFERYVAREFDLYQDLVAACSDWPTYSYGIKQIARLTGFSWRDADPGGANSIAWYNDYLKETDPAAREGLLRRILEYNEDDCRAMAHIVEWFRNQRQEPGRRGCAPREVEIRSLLRFLLEFGCPLPMQ